MTTALTTNNPNTALTRSNLPGFDLFAFHDLKQAMDVCSMIQNSQFVPSSFRGKPGDIMLAIHFGRSLGLDGLQALQNIAVINGKPSVWGDAVLAMISSRKDFIDCEETLNGTGEAMVAKCIITRSGRKPVERTFSVAQAKRAGLWGKAGPWQQYPERMLAMRARAFAIRDSYPDALKGISVGEEVIDIEPAEDAPQTVATVAGGPKLSRADRLAAMGSGKTTIVEPKTPNDIVAERLRENSPLTTTREADKTLPERIHKAKLADLPTLAKEIHGQPAEAASALWIRFVERLKAFVKWAKDNAPDKLEHIETECRRLAQEWVLEMLDACGDKISGALVMLGVELPSDDDSPEDAGWAAPYEDTAVEEHVEPAPNPELERLISLACEAEDEIALVPVIRGLHNGDWSHMERIKLNRAIEVAKARIANAAAEAPAPQSDAPGLFDKKPGAKRT